MTSCQPYHLRKIVIQFLEAQLEAVKEIEFEGLLHLQLTITITKMLLWLVNNFDQSNCYFEIQNGNGFVLTPDDVYDVFGLSFLFLGPISFTKPPKNIITLIVGFNLMHILRYTSQSQINHPFTMRSQKA